MQNGNCQVDETILQDLASTLSKSNPITASCSGRGPLSTAWKRKTYYKKHFNIVESVEFVLDSQNKKSFQYISILKSLQQILSCETFLDKATNLKSSYEILFMMVVITEKICRCQRSVLFHLFYM